ncbi:MAG TPA: DUF4123 domain-containing protein [Luteimonas sp.]|nr:DUF4123 domain-containing protein [Luteimonas sp.]
MATDRFRPVAGDHAANGTGARASGVPVARVLAAAGHGDAFVLLDGARVPRLRDRLQATGCDYWCLLCADLDSPLRDGVPYLLRLRRTGDRARAATPLQPSPAGVLLLPPRPVCGSVLRTHLRHWLRAPLRTGRSAVFRFFDPECLQSMLPLLTEDARRDFLAPLGRVFVEAAVPGGTLEVGSTGPDDGDPMAASRGGVASSAQWPARGIRWG